MQQFLRFALEPLLRRRCARGHAINCDVSAIELFAEDPREHLYGAFCRAVNRVSGMCMEYARRRQIDDSSTTTHTLGCLTKTQKRPLRIDRKRPVVRLVRGIGDWRRTDVRSACVVDEHVQSLEPFGYLVK